MKLQSWSSRLGSSVKGIILGLIILGISFPVLWNNEARMIHVEKSLNEASKIVESIKNNKILSENNKKLVYLTGIAKTTDIVKDKEIGFKRNTLSLNRSIEMYQWDEIVKEETIKKGDKKQKTKKSYEYEKKWLSKQNDSSDFQNEKNHFNPKMQYETETFFAKNVNLGVFRLTENQIKRISYNKSVDFLKTDLDKTNPSIQKNKKIIDGKLILFSKKKHNIFKENQESQIGDYKIEYSVSPNSKEISLIAKQINDTFEPYISKTNKEIFLVKSGVHSPENMISEAKNDNKTKTWFIRLAGFLLMFLGLSLLTRLLVVISDIIPFLGYIVSTGLGIVNGLLALSLSFVTIAIAWVSYRPHIALILIIIAGLILFAVKYVKKIKK